MYKKISFEEQKKKLLFQLGLFIIPAVIFFLLFIPVNNPVLKYVSVVVRYNNLRFLPILAIALLIALSIKNVRLSTFLTALIIFPICALALVGLWASMYTEMNVIAGILPRIDAMSFFTSALTLIEKGVLVGFTTRRPLFGGFFAFLLWLFNSDLQAAIILSAFFSAIVFFLTIIEVRRILNPIATVVFFIPQFLFYRMYIGNVLSETLGFYLGMASFYFFLRTINLHEIAPKKSIAYFSLAAFLYTLSQLARPGAILTIPLLVLFSWWLYRRDKPILLYITLVILSITIAFLINGFVFNTLTEGRTSQYNNAGFGLYGVVAGGKSWAQLKTDHPEISSLPTGIREKYIMEVIISEFINRPGNFLKGMQVQFYFIFSIFPIYYYNIYSYMLSYRDFFDEILIGTYYLLSMLGIVAIIHKRSHIFSIFIATLLFGFFISLPFSPAYQSQFMRYYPASIPLLGILPAVGTQWISSKFIKKPAIENQNISEIRFPIHYVGILFSVFALLLGPYIVALMSAEKSHIELNCLPNETQVVMPYYKRSQVNVKTITSTWAPNVSIEDFQKSIFNIPDNKTKNYFKNLPLPVVIFPSVNILNNGSLYVMVEENQIPANSSMLNSCGIIEDVNGNRSSSGFYYPRIIEIE